MDGRSVKGFIAAKSSSWQQNDFVRNTVAGFKLMLSERVTRIYLSIILFILFMAAVGPTLAPYRYDERIRTEDGSLYTAAPPSLDHPMGTTTAGHDVFSLLLWGAQPTVAAGIIGGTMIMSIGLFIGITSGYIGGRYDDIVMRFTDLAYGVPLIPFALVLVALFGVGWLEAILVIGVILWRGPARVIRSQVLQIRERPFIQAARADGASTTRIILRHILPNVAPMAVMFMAISTGATIILMASLAFLGVIDPFRPDWGIMIRNAYNSGAVARAWWWALAPGFSIVLTVLALIMFGRGYERVTSGDRTGGEAFA